MSGSGRQKLPKRVLVDSNLLIVWVTGNCNRLLVGETKRTNGYSPELYDQLLEVLGRFDEIIVTPNIVTECSDLLGNSRPGASNCPEVQALKYLVDEGALVIETYVPSTTAVQRSEYSYLGVADCSLLELVDENTILFSEDTRLVYEARKINPDSLSFAQIREDIHGRL